LRFLTSMLETVDLAGYVRLKSEGLFETTRNFLEIELVKT